MGVAIAAAIAAYSAALSIVEARLLEELGSGDAVSKGLVAAVAAAASLWGLAVASRSVKSVRGRRLAFITASAAAGGGVAAAMIIGDLPVLFTSLVLVASSLGLAGFAASNTLYNDNDYTRWRDVVAGYYIASSLLASIILAAVKTWHAWPIALAAALAGGVLAARSVKGAIISNVSLKILENFAHAAAGWKVPRLKPWEIVRASSILGSLSALKISLMPGIAAVMGEWALVVYGASYSVGAALAYQTSSLTAASLLAILGLLILAADPGPAATLVVLGGVTGYTSLSTVYYVIEAAPRKLRLASIAMLAWTGLGAVVVGASYSIYGEEAAVKAAMLIVALGFIAADRSRKARPQWS